MTLDLRGVRVAVTGASGFCGGAVALAAAAAGADVVGLSRRPGPVGKHIPWDAAAEVPDLAGADIVLHLAAAVGDPAPRPEVAAAFWAVNVDGTRRLLEAARARPVVWVSSASVYRPAPSPSSSSSPSSASGTARGSGSASVDGPQETVREDHPIGGQHNAYGRSKAEGERLALAGGAVVLRPRAVYGPGDPHLVPRLLSRVRRGLALLPGPDVRLSLTAVENLADACLAAPGWPAGAYNITDESAYWRDAAVRSVLAAHGRPARLVHVPVALARGAARVAEAGAGVRASAEPFLTRYAVDQLAHGMVLDLAKATAQGWRPRRDLSDYLADLGRLRQRA